MSDISRWHKEMNFPKSQSGSFCGYHYVIKRSGEVEQARFDNEIGAHCRGSNKDSIGIVWVGRDEITKAQMTALIDLLSTICQRYALEPKQIFGHRELNPGKTCPNIKEMDNLRNEVELKINQKAG
jgi:N-acetylmuramoyl-L-alanine amidase